MVKTERAESLTLPNVKTGTTSTIPSADAGRWAKMPFCLPTDDCYALWQLVMAARFRITSIGDGCSLSGRRLDRGQILRPAGRDDATSVPYGRAAPVHGLLSTQAAKADNKSGGALVGNGPLPKVTWFIRSRRRRLRRKRAEKINLTLV